MADYKSIEQFLPLITDHQELATLFNTVEDITITLASLQAASTYGTFKTSASGNGGGIGLESERKESSSVLCLVMGEGHIPRTSVLAAVENGWSVVAIESELGNKWQGPQNHLIDSVSGVSRYLGFRGTMDSFLVEGKEAIQTAQWFDVSKIRHLIIIAIERSTHFDHLKTLRGRCGIADLRMLYNNAPVTVISVAPEENAAINDIECNERHCPFKFAPDHSFVDDHHHVQVWKFASSLGGGNLPSDKIKTIIYNNECSSSSSLSASHGDVATERHHIASSIRLQHSKSMITSLTDEFYNNVDRPAIVTNDLIYTRRSKVAQLHRQQALASMNHAEIRKGRYFTIPPTYQIPQEETTKSNKDSVGKTCRLSLSKGKFKSNGLIQQQSPPSINIESPPKVSLSGLKIWPLRTSQQLLTDSIENKFLGLSEAKSQVKREETRLSSKCCAANKSKSSLDETTDVESNNMAAEKVQDTKSFDSMPRKTASETYEFAGKGT